MIGPGELERLRIHLGALESMTRILDRVAEEVCDGPEDGELEGAIAKAYDGLEELERRARRDLEVVESLVSSWGGS